MHIKTLYLTQNRQNFKKIFKENNCIFRKQGHRIHRHLLLENLCLELGVIEFHHLHTMTLFQDMGTDTSELPSDSFSTSMCFLEKDED